MEEKSFSFQGCCEFSSSISIIFLCLVFNMIIDCCCSAWQSPVAQCTYLSVLFHFLPCGEVSQNYNRLWMLKMMTIISPFLCFFQEVISVKGIALWLKSLIREKNSSPKNESCAIYLQNNCCPVRRLFNVTDDMQLMHYIQSLHLKIHLLIILSCCDC